MARADLIVELPEAVGWNRLRRPVWLFDDDAKRHVYANDAALKLWGAATREEFLTRDCSDQSEAAQARTRQLFERTAGGEHVAERWTFYPNGRPATAHVLVSTYELSDGRRLLMMEADQQDVGAEDLRSQEILRHIPTLVTLIGEDGDRLFENPAAYRAYGRQDGPTENRFTQPGVGHALMELAASGATTSQILRVRTHAGERWHHVEARPAMDPVTGMRCVLVNEHDISAQIDAEEALLAAAERVELTAQREAFLTKISHEMRTPLNTILGFTELMSEDSVDPEQRDMLRRVSVSGASLLTMFNEMLAALDGETPFSETAAQPAVGEVRSSRRPLRILYADDHENNRMIVCAMLRQMGCECDTAEDGLEAVECVRFGDYDLVLMDILMPRMDGVEAARTIRALPDFRRRTPIVALTANTLDRQVRRYRAAGMEDCLAKPVAMADLIGKVANWTVEDWRAAERSLETTCA